MSKQIILLLSKLKVIRVNIGKQSQRGKRKEERERGESLRGGMEGQGTTTKARV